MPQSRECTGTKRKVKDITKVPLQETIDELQPDRKKPKMSQFEFTNTTISAPDSSSSYKHLDTLWMVSFNNSNNIPMWTGWNTQTHREQCPQQIIIYMKLIPLPPTRTDVVKETLIRSIKVSEECRSRHTIVTYDLAIAKVAKQIKCFYHVWSVSY